MKFAISKSEWSVKGRQFTPIQSEYLTFDAVEPFIAELKRLSEHGYQVGTVLAYAILDEHPRHGQNPNADKRRAAGS